MHLYDYLPFFTAFLTRSTLKPTVSYSNALTGALSIKLPNPYHAGTSILSSLIAWSSRIYPQPLPGTALPRIQSGPPRRPGTTPLQPGLLIQQGLFLSYG
jgi:hypothetical protein